MCVPFALGVEVSVVAYNANVRLGVVYQVIVFICIVCIAL